jgi:cytochrome P450
VRRYIAAVVRRVRPLLHRRSPPAAPLSAATIDLRAPQIVNDPFPRYETLRQEGSVLYLPRHDYWIVLGHEAVRSAFARPEHFSNAPYRDVDAALLAADPPEQTAMRRTVARLFSPAVTARLEDTASRLADALVRPGLDVVSDYGIPISRGVTADLLGLDAVDVEEIVAAEARSMGTTDPLADFIASLDAMAHRSSMFDVLIGAEIPEASARSLVRLMWLAGTTTTQRVISRAILRAIENEGDQRALRADPGLVRPFVEEVLRLHPPEHMVPRVARADVELDGVVIPAGAQVRLCVSAANRDPAQFDRPDQLRLDRGTTRHFAFGSGAHACIGAQIGRATANIAVATLLRRSSALHSLRPLAEIRYFATETALSPESLQVGL